MTLRVPTLPRPVSLDHGESANHGLVSVTSLLKPTGLSAWSPAGSAPLLPVPGPAEAGRAFPGLISRELLSTQFPGNISYLSLTASSSRSRQRGLAPHEPLHLRRDTAVRVRTRWRVCLPRLPLLELMSVLFRCLSDTRDPASPEVYSSDLEAIREVGFSKRRSSVSHVWKTKRRMQCSLSTGHKSECQGLDLESGNLPPKNKWRQR